MKCDNENIINGVTKNGVPVVLLIRPGDSRSINFHQDYDKEILGLDNSELWVNTPPNDCRIILLGQILLWNGISQIKIPQF